MKLYEQVDVTNGKGRYSWLLSGVPYRHRKQLPDWKWISGRPGCYVTNDYKVAKSLNLPIESNGTHQANNMPLYQE